MGNNDLRRLEPTETDLKAEADWCRDLDDAVVGIPDAVRLYLDSVSHVPLLTMEQEVALGRKLQAGMKRHGETRRLTPSAKRARDQMVTANLRLVVSVAKRYQNYGMEFLDLIQEGNLGLVRAVEGFDPEKGFRFSTYATWWIRQAITRAIADQARTIRIPVHMHTQIGQMRRVRRQLTADLQREPTQQEIAAELGWSVQTVAQILKYVQDPVSLEMSVNEDGDSTLLGELVHDPQDEASMEKVTERLDYENWLQRVLKLVETLPPRMCGVMKLRAGLYQELNENGESVWGQPLTLQQVGEHYGVTRERIRQIQAKAMRILVTQPEWLELVDELKGRYAD
jgi:RNA polymerase primary sigma factor